MKVNDICITKATRSRTHPEGTKVQIVLAAPEGYDDPEKYYCKAVDGDTSYWYRADELEVIERFGMV